MTAADWIALASAVIAAVGALTAIWQARSARQAVLEAASAADRPEFQVRAKEISHDEEGRRCWAQVKVEQISGAASTKVEIIAKGQYVRGFVNPGNGGAIIIWPRCRPWLYSGPEVDIDRDHVDP